MSEKERRELQDVRDVGVVLHIMRCGLPGAGYSLEWRYNSEWCMIAGFEDGEWLSTITEGRMADRGGVRARVSLMTPDQWRIGAQLTGCCAPLQGASFQQRATALMAYVGWRTRVCMSGSDASDEAALLEAPPWRHHEDV